MFQRQRITPARFHQESGVLGIEKSTRDLYCLVGNKNSFRRFLVLIKVSLTLELPASGDVNSLEPIVVQAGRRAMENALREACREYERQVVACPHCQSERLQGEGTDRRILLCSFGRVELYLRRLRCEQCWQRFRPADRFLSCLEGGNVSAQLKQACVLAGASWPYATAATVLRDLCGAKVSAETVRQLTRQAGGMEVAEQLETVEKILNPTAKEVRAQRESELSQETVSEGGPPELLMVGLDGGWVPSREQVGGMEGKVGVIASEVQNISKGRRRLSQRRYVATFGSSERLGLLAYGAATELRGEDACWQVVVGDGAKWIKTEAKLHFPQAVKILDWPHVVRAVQRAIRATLPGKKRREERKERYKKVIEPLWLGKVDEALAELEALRSKEWDEPVVALEEAIGYLQGQRDWLGNYQAWQEEGYPIGSGLVERAVELVINRRFKRRGMRWCRANADAVVALRVRTINTEWELSTSPIAA